MPKFFVDPEEIGDASIRLTGDQAAHIAKTLRMRPGDLLTVCDGANIDRVCRIVSLSAREVEAEILSAETCASEPSLELTLFLSLPKSDKLELVVQKAVELGAARICVFRSAYSIPDPDRQSFEKRLQRLGRIAREAAGQSLRGRIPAIEGLFGYDEMLERASRCDAALFFYERGGRDLKTLLRDDVRTAAVVIGPEGGFSEEEHRRAGEAGLMTATLGPRILRCETAAICAVAAVLFQAGELG